jgi:predicted ribonuclease YlaK
VSKIKFYDTCSLLALQEKAFNEEEKFYISGITINELENIKTSSTRDEEIKYNARTIIRLLANNQNKYEVIPYTTDLDPLLSSYSLPLNADNKIIISALNKDVEFITQDLLCYKIAKDIVGLDATLLEQQETNEYTGFKILELDETGLADFYTHYADNKNSYNLLENQYIIIKCNGELIDKYKWKNEHYEAVQFQKAESKMFGKIAPKHGDVFQQCALDSLNNNQITMLRGRAGTGKTYLAFGYMFSLLERGKIDKIIIFCNTVATKGSARLGFYPGSRTEKLLDSQIGNLLESKLGDRIAVERLIDDGTIVLLPMADIRGYDTTGMKAGIYITEAQNMDIELMRLALQRIGDDCICILDGDSDAQVDLSLYSGTNNGLKRVSAVFRGHEIYGEVELPNIYRSEIANIAQRL